MHVMMSVGGYKVGKINCAFSSQKDSVMFGIAFHAAFIGEDCTLVFKREEVSTHFA